MVSEENAAINENNRFTERFNFELAFNNLPLSKLFKGYLSVTLEIGKKLANTGPARPQ